MLKTRASRNTREKQAQMELAADTEWFGKGMCRTLHSNRLVGAKKSTSRAAAGMETPSPRRPRRVPIRDEQFVSSLTPGRLSLDNEARHESPQEILSVRDQDAPLRWEASEQEHLGRGHAQPCHQEPQYQSQVIALDRGDDVLSERLALEEPYQYDESNREKGIYNKHIYGHLGDGASPAFLGRNPSFQCLVREVKEGGAEEETLEGDGEGLPHGLAPNSRINESISVPRRIDYLYLCERHPPSFRDTRR